MLGLFLCLVVSFLKILYSATIHVSLSNKAKVCKTLARRRTIEPRVAVSFDCGYLLDGKQIQSKSIKV